MVGKDCEEDYIVAKNAEEALERAHEKYGKDVEIYQDPDVLDTWFSRLVSLLIYLEITFLLCVTVLEIVSS